MSAGPQSHFDIRNHPIAIAGTVAIAVFGVMVTYFTQVAIPTQTAQLQNEIAALKKQLNIPDEQTAKALTRQVSNLEAELKIANRKVAELQLTNLFALGNPYPIGLGQIKIGDSFESISKLYPESAIDRKGGWWSVKGQHKAFSQVTYYLDRNAKEKRVTHILFHFDLDSPPGVLQAKLVEALGQPSSSGPKKDCVKWKLDQRLFVRAEPTIFTVTPSERTCEPD